MVKPAPVSIAGMRAGQIMLVPTPRMIADFMSSVPAGQTLTATATPRTLFDLGLYFVEGAASACDASPITCLAGIDANDAGEAETVTHTNSSGSAQTVMVVVDSFDPDDWGPYSLELQVQ